MFLFFWVCRSVYARTENVGLDTAKSDVIREKRKVWNPVMTGMLSTAIPGSGQVVTGHYVKAGLFVGLEVISASIASFWYRTSLQRLEAADESLFSAWQASDWQEHMLSMEKASLDRFSALGARYSMYNALSWMIGGYVYNILDAVGSSRHFESDTRKSPLKAAWLSAIPGLGLGQLYNGSVSKAGLVIMIQGSLGIKAYNEHRLMRKAESNFSRALSIRDSLDTAFVAREYNDQWLSYQRTAFRNRNSYLWYSLFFYVFGILDAVVDAHLHDYHKKIRAYPDLIPEQKAFRMNFDYFF